MRKATIVISIFSALTLSVYAYSSKSIIGFWQSKTKVKNRRSMIKGAEIGYIYIFSKSGTYRFLGTINGRPLTEETGRYEIKNKYLVLKYFLANRIKARFKILKLTKKEMILIISNKKIRFKKER